MDGSADGILRRWLRRLCGGVLALFPFLVPPPPASAMHDPDHAGTVGVLRGLPLNDTAWGLLSLPASPEAGDRPAGIVLLGDGQSVLDGRSELYAQRLLSLGYGVFDADFDGQVADEGTPTHPDVEPIERRLGLALGALDQRAQLDLDRLAVIGIGRGARAVLERWARHGGSFRAAVLLYPVCDADLLARAPALRPPPGHGRVLLVHGDVDDGEAANCGALAAALGGADRGVARHVLRGADLAWDIDAAVPEARYHFPDPSNPAELRLAQPDDARAAVALDRMLIFLMAALAPPQLSSSASQ